jgi:hypothetical protein
MENIDQEIAHQQEIISQARVVLDDRTHKQDSRLSYWIEKNSKAYDRLHQLQRRKEKRL